MPNFIKKKFDKLTKNKKLETVSESNIPIKVDDDVSRTVSDSLSKLSSASTIKPLNIGMTINRVKDPEYYQNGKPHRSDVHIDISRSKDEESPTRISRCMTCGRGIPLDRNYRRLSAPLPHEYSVIPGNSSSELGSPSTVSPTYCPITPRDGEITPSGVKIVRKQSPKTTMTDLIRHNAIPFPVCVEYTDDA